MNLRFDKVIRSVGFGFRKVYSLVLSDEGLYLVRTGSVRTLKYYRMDANRQIVALNENDRGVKEIQKNEGRIDSTPLDDLVKESDSFVVRLEAIEEVKIKAGRSPEMLIEVTGSDHYLVFPYASLEEVETLQRALNKWSVKK
jgi:precorrin-6B methylase 2